MTEVTRTSAGRRFGLQSEEVEQGLETRRLVSAQFSSQPVSVGT